jgi:hypothetical protein
MITWFRLLSNRLTSECKPLYGEEAISGVLQRLHHHIAPASIAPCV